MPPRPPARRPEPPRREEHREPMRPGPHPVGQGFRGPEPHLMDPDFVDLDRGLLVTHQDLCVAQRNV